MTLETTSVCEPTGAARPDWYLLDNQHLPGRRWLTAPCVLLLQMVQISENVMYDVIVGFCGSS